MAACILVTEKVVTLTIHEREKTVNHSKCARALLRVLSHAKSCELFTEKSSF